MSVFACLSELYAVSVSLSLCFFFLSSFSSLSLLYFCLSLLSWMQELLMFKLRGSSNSPSNPPDLMNFELGSESHGDAEDFNPLLQFDHIGKRKLDQVRETFSRLLKQFILVTYIINTNNQSFFKFRLCCTCDVQGGVVLPLSKGQKLNI